jgi:hypothetical protein
MKRTVQSSKTTKEMTNPTVTKVIRINILKRKKIIIILTLLTSLVLNKRFSNTQTAFKTKKRSIRKNQNKLKSLEILNSLNSLNSLIL